MLKVYLYGDMSAPIVKKALLLMIEQGCMFMTEPEEADVAVAPLLTTKVPTKDLYAPRYGTLIFHPSLLPRHKGPDAIKWAMNLGEAYSGATWFWADTGYDTGDICEMEVLSFTEGETARAYYENKVIPSALRMLEYIVRDLKAGIARRRPQQHEHGTYESKIPRGTKK